jgi:hypothetical protein
MNYDTLVPEVAGILQSHPDWTNQQVADYLNEPAVTTCHSRFATFRTVLSEMPIAQAMTIIGKLRAEASTDPAGVLGVILPTLENTAEGCGVDLANTNARAFVDGLVTAEVLTAEEAAAVKALAETTISRAAQLGLGIVGDGHVQSAREMI